VFVDEEQVADIEYKMRMRGYLEGKKMAQAFNLLRSNDLIWPYIIRNYLKGEPPPPFDLLHWNSDGTNLPGPMFCYYLRNTYLENKLCVPRTLLNCGVAVDLGKVTIPAFVLSSREDHIVPWRSAYRTLNHLGSADKTFVLGASGHIAGVINPPAANRRSHWIGEPYPADPGEWLSEASEKHGSWWPRWAEWLEKHTAGKRKAPERTGSTKYKPIEPAPGRYVKHRVH
jgi:polyhydroxyalkanoate synthase